VAKPAKTVQGARTAREESDRFYALCELSLAWMESTCHRDTRFVVTNLRSTPVCLTRMSTTGAARERGVVCLPETA
jgi:hypothetical protein